MRILILANFDVGLYKFRKELIQELINRGNEVLISLPYGEMVEPLKRMGCQFIDTNVDRRGINPLKDFGLIKAYFSIIKRNKPDIVITYTIKPNIYGGIVCRLTKTNYAANITGLGTAFQKKNLLKSFVTYLYKISLKRAKVIFFENAENRDIFINSKIIKKENTCLLNGAGVNLEEYSYLEYPQSEDPIRFLFMGRVMKEKGINELFEAMKMLRKDGINCVLDVLGGYEENYKEIIEKYENEGWLFYHGFQKDVRPFIKNCYCFVLPSWHEGMANTNLECAASGRPVITSNIHGCLEAIVDGKTGFLFEKQNSESLYQAMKNFTELSDKQRKQMGLLGRAHMEMFFDKKIVIRETINRLNIGVIKWQKNY